ncbi:hypothetical protein VRC24_12670 [Pseudomonas poae]|uniref:hypothetical protein n=1 Tax=Pseudomonas poae TaxID=200451 RepID=UPI0030D19298
MGSKIPEARNAFGAKVSALQYESSPVGQLSCPSNGCDARLSFVKRHDRRYSTKTIEVAPCFRLKKQFSHDANCKYNIGGQLSIIAKESSSDLFSAISASKFEFRLHILIKALWELDDTEVEARGRGWGSPESKNKAYGNKGRLTNYLKTLSQILELRALCEDNDELKNLVTLKSQETTIPWSKFYFDHSNLGDFTRWYGTDTLTIPLAIAGYVQDIRLPSDRFPYHVAELTSPYVEPDQNGIVRKPVPQVILKQSALASLLKRHHEYIFFGQWKARVRQTRGREDATQTWLFENIEMYIDQADHFIEC